MLAELDILAIEPFYGGQRKAMLETLIRGSGHRWTLLKLPPRRIERRLVSAAQWFSEHLNLHWVANVDLIFASDALNLADLYRLIPTFAGKPSVVYFHDNQLPVVGSALDFPAADESEQGGQPVQTAQPVGPTPVPVQPEAPPIIPAARPVLAAVHDVEVGSHLHASPHQAAEKVRAAYQAGCRRFDMALGGQGGCPFAQDALVGNLATENALAELKHMGAKLPPLHPLDELLAMGRGLANSFSAAKIQTVQEG